jgi:hypothetical protein
LPLVLLGRCDFRQADAGRSPNDKNGKPQASNVFLRGKPQGFLSRSSRPTTHAAQVLWARSVIRKKLRAKSFQAADDAGLIGRGAQRGARGEGLLAVAGER